MSPIISLLQNSIILISLCKTRKLIKVKEAKTTPFLIPKLALALAMALLL